MLYRRVKKIIQLIKLGRLWLKSMFVSAFKKGSCDGLDPGYQQTINEWSV